MHGAPAEEQDGDADHQEDAQQGLREHGRPKSANNLVEQAAGHTATASHRAGRPPLAETTSTNRHGFKVRTLLLLLVTDAQLGHGYSYQCTQIVRKTTTLRLAPLLITLHHEPDLKSMWHWPHQTSILAPVQSIDVRFSCAKWRNSLTSLLWTLCATRIHLT